MGVVGGAIQGVHAPFQIARGLASAALLCQHTNLRGFPVQQIEHRSLCGMVSLRNQIAGTALLTNLLKAAEALAELNATQLCSLPGKPTKALKVAAAEARVDGSQAAGGLAGQRKPHLTPRPRGGQPSLCPGQRTDQTEGRRPRLHPGFPPPGDRSNEQHTAGRSPWP